MQGHNVLEHFFQFYALLATSFSLTIWHAQQRGACRYARTVFCFFCSMAPSYPGGASRVT